MIEKTKLGLWDFFVSALSGYAIIVSVLAHCLFKGVITWEIILNSSVALIAVAGLLTIILAGLLFEPLANYAAKLFIVCMYKYSRLFGFKNWDDNIRSLEEKARQDVPEGIKENTYQYCKNRIIKNASGNAYMPFLAKYGFYRSMFFLLLLNSISIPFIYQFSWIKTMMASLFMLALALVYLRRSGDFYRHMSVTIYSQFISLHNTKTKSN